MQREVISAWFDHVIGTYPEASSKAIRNNSDQFANPVGYTLNESLTIIYKELGETMDLKKLAEALDNIVRIRAIQDFTASDALGFICALKGIMRKVLGEDAGSAAQWRDIDERLDSILLAAFDIYTDCRKSIYEIRTEEVKRQVHMLLRKTEDVPQ